MQEGFLKDWIPAPKKKMTHIETYTRVSDAIESQNKPSGQKTENKKRDLDPAFLDDRTSLFI
jgi:hypothetical protein